MSRKQILEILHDYHKEFGSEFGIISLGIFGSTARDEATDTSDVDVVITLEHPNLLTLSRIRLELEERLHKHVDIVSYRKRMNPFLKKRIEQEACYA